MIEFVIVLGAVLVLIAMSRRADRRFRRVDRLPMQWLLSGEVTWTAPRRIALSLIPGLAATILTAMAVMMRLTKPRPGQEGYEIPILLIMAALWVAIHAFHIWMIGRTLGGRGQE